MRNSGFTLVEMAVVLVIIGLIASAVVAGKEIVEVSRTRGIMAEIRDNMQSFEQFGDTYRAYPGDFNQASEVFVDGIDQAVEDAQIVKAGITKESFNGNGDNRVTWEAPEGGGASQTTGEGALAWLHLKLAGLGKHKNLVGAVANGVAVLSSNVPTGTAPNVPASTIDNSFGYFIDYNSTMQNHLGLGRQSTTINNGVSLSPQRTEAIDKKMDDGKPNLGIVQAVGNNCTFGGDAYNFSNDVARESISCLPLVRLN